MENYIVSARKYRPVTFDSVVGQSALTTTLKNAIKTGKLAHAFLFCGPRGVGKTTCARIFAKTINCMHPKENGEACDACESCMSFNEQRSFNIHELDAASNNSVDDIRGLIEEVRIPPQVGKYKVFIIDEVHMLSSAAFNAFLKTLEEPPHHAIFILATTEKHKILPTILSRCQIYDFNRMSVADTVRHLQYVAQQEGVEADAESLNVIAQKADGGMRDALSIFDQVVSFTGGHLTYDKVIANLNVLDYEYYFRLVDSFLENKVKDCMLLFNEILNKGFQGDHFINGLAKHLRDLMVSKDFATLPLLEVGDSVKLRYQQQAEKCSAKFLFSALKICNECDLGYRASKNKRLQVELALIQCAQLTAPDDAVSGGLRPAKILKPIFTEQPVAVKPAAVVSAPVAQQPQVQKTVVTPSVQQQPVDTPKPVVKSSQSVMGKKIGLGFSIRNANLNKEVKDEISPEQQAAREAALQVQQQKPVTQEKLTFYWNEFMQLLPHEEAALRGRMESMEVKLLAPELFEVVVENKQVQSEMERVRNSLLLHLQKGIGNFRLQMNVRVAAPGEFVRAFTPIEKYREMCKKNDALEKLRQEFFLDVK
ncbi:MAG: DNA polymerase III subunit gamma/tau [Bacteroidaceae bacterium]|nr:DNA polymerase III subunit gamma/tau [Bacteroidaceae bacterium]